jgi:hypothetical protein
VTRGKGWRRRYTAKQGGLEVEGDSDRWGRPGSEWEKEEGEKVGRRRLRGPEEEVGRLEKETREGRWAAGLGWAGGELGRLDRFVFFFSNPFQTNFKPF